MNRSDSLALFEASQRARLTAPYQHSGGAVGFPKREAGAGRALDKGGVLAPVATKVASPQSQCVVPKYLVKAGRIYDVDGNDLGALSWRTNHDLMAKMQKSPGLVRLVKPNEPVVRIGTTTVEHLHAHDPSSDRHERLRGVNTFLVKAEAVYDQDGRKLGRLSWKTDRDLMQVLQKNPGKVRLLGPHDRLGHTVIGAEIPLEHDLNDHTVVIEEQKIGPDGLVVKDARGDPVYATRTVPINARHFTIRAGLVWDGDGHYLGTYQRRKELIAKNDARSVTWIGPRPEGVPEPHPTGASNPTKNGQVRAGADYMLGDAVDDISNNGWNIGNTSKAALGLVTGIYEYAFHVGYGDEHRSPFGALRDSLTGRHPKENGITYINANGIDANIRPEQAKWVEDHYNQIKETTAGATKTVVTVATTMGLVALAKMKPQQAKLIGEVVGAAVGKGSVQLGESLADYDLGKKDALDVVGDVSKAVAKAEAVELIDIVVRRLPFPVPDGVKHRMSAKVAKGLVKLSANQIDLWTSPVKPGETREQELERKRKRGQALAVADIEAMGIDLAAEAIHLPNVRGHINTYAKDIIKGLLGGTVLDNVPGLDLALGHLIGAEPAEEAAG